MKNFNIEITSVDDRENLVAEIWYLNKYLVAEINQEESMPTIMLYNTSINLPVNEFIHSLNLAIDKLMG